MNLIPKNPKIILNIFLLLTICFLPSVVNSKQPVRQPELKADAFTRLKADFPLSERTKNILKNRGTEKVKVWVFFTDKGVTDKAGFNAKAVSVHISERAMARRRKVNADRVLFVDLQVERRYINSIEQLGGNLKRSSRWLNAASFEIETSLLEQVASLPFVSEIKPVAIFKKKMPITDSVSSSREPAPSTAALSYGASLGQLTQINVPAAHDAGYSGLGVTLAIMDTGFRKSHTAFAFHISSGRLLAEYDFVMDDSNTANEVGDPSNADSHGTNTWSIAAGESPGNIYGPAYQANIILCKTEDLRSETSAEEDNWVAALEFSDSIGVDVISTSLGYSVFDDPTTSYSPADMDGRTAIITKAANLTDGLGIVFCNSAGNSGPLPGTITAPADAFEILTVGAVTSNGSITSFSSRGPTADGRPKPEVVAQGAAVTIASSFSDNSYSAGNGTSYSTPLVAGAACLVLEAHPDWTPAQVRNALICSGSLAASFGTNPAVDNSYGYGIIDVLAAINWVPPCCEGRVGNANSSISEEPSVGDISAMIDLIFNTGTLISCLGEADADRSGGSNPTAADISVADITVLIDHLFTTGTQLPRCLCTYGK